MLTTLLTPATEFTDPLIDETWDDRLRSFDEATVFHSSAWAGVLAQAYNYKPCYLRTEGSEGLAMLPLVEVSSWITGRRGVSVPFGDICGPIGRDSNRISDLERAAVNLGRSRGWKYLEIRSGNPDCGNASARFLTHTLDLTRGEATLWEGIGSANRRAVRKAEASGLRVEFTAESSSLKEFVALLRLTRRRHGAPPQPPTFFDAIYQNLISRGQGMVVLARDGREAIAGALFLYFGQTVTFKFGASNYDYQHLRGNNLVMWRAISHYANAGYRKFDFGRTDQDQTGLRQFKLSWGPTERIQAYRRISCNASVPASSHHHGMAKYSGRLLKHLPTPLFNSLGNLLYKHIG